MQNHSKFSWYLDNPISAASEKPRAGLKSATEKKLAVLSENHHSGIQKSFYLFFAELSNLTWLAQEQP